LSHRKAGQPGDPTTHCTFVQAARSRQRGDWTKASGQRVLVHRGPSAPGE